MTARGCCHQPICRAVRRALQGMGRAIGEALLLGVPVTGTAVAGVVDASENFGRGGLLSPLEQPEQLLAAMRQFEDDRVLIERLAAEGKA